jgi:CrcB protein
MMIIYLAVAVGGAIGSVGRFWLASFMLRLTGPQFPWGTILINILGSFVIGWFAAITAAGGRYQASNDMRAFIMIGICGGFTTFSSFSLQTVDLLRSGEPARAAANVAVSVAACLSATALGLMLGRQ